jgi:hypothetical protein
MLQKEAVHYIKVKLISRKKVYTLMKKKKLKVLKIIIQNSKITIEEQKRLNELLGDLDKDKAVKEAAFQQEENKKSNCSQTKRD